MTSVLILILSCISSISFSQDTKFSGQVKNSTKTSATISYSEPPSLTRHYVEVPIDNKGNFKFNLNISEPLYALISFGGTDGLSVVVYLEPGDHSSLSVDLLRFQQTLIFKEDRVKENIFLHTIDLAFHSEKDRQRLDYLNKKGTPEQYSDYVDSTAQAKKNLLIKTLLLKEDFLKERASLEDPEKLRFAKKYFYEITYETLNQKLDFIRIFEHYQGKPMLPSKYYYKGTFKDDELPDIVFKLNDDALVSGEYIKYVDRYIRHKLSNLGKGVYWDPNFLPTNPDYKFQIANSISQQQYFVSKMCLNSKTLAYLLAYYVCEAFETRTFEEALPIYEQFKKDCNDTLLLSRVNKVYELSKKFAKGQFAPSFKLEDLKGKVVNLEDFRGKVIYIDFWASWCAPCLQSMKYSSRLKKEFKNDEDLVFLYISLDENEKHWKNAIEKYLIEGIHLQAKNGYKDSVPISYGVIGVPKYVLIDRRGKIFNIDAPRPEEINVSEEIKSALIR